MMVRSETIEKQLNERVPVRVDVATLAVDLNIASTVMKPCANGDRRPDWNHLIRQVAKRTKTKLDGRTLMCVAAALARAALVLALIVGGALVTASDRGHWNQDCFADGESRGVRTVLGFMCCIDAGGPGVFYESGSECSFLYDLDLSGSFPNGAEITLGDYAILQNNFSVGWWGPLGPSLFESFGNWYVIPEPLPLPR